MLGQKSNIVFNWSDLWYLTRACVWVIQCAGNKVIWALLSNFKVGLWLHMAFTPTLLHPAEERIDFLICKPWTNYLHKLCVCVCVCASVRVCVCVRVCVWERSILSFLTECWIYTWMINTPGEHTQGTLLVLLWHLTEVQKYIQFNARDSF